MSKPWGNIGAWAADSERAEDEEREAAASATAESHSFPSLKEAVTAKPKKSKKTMSLMEFNAVAASESRGLTHDEMLRLPTRPKERSSDEMQFDGGRWGGGGRRSYGGFDDEQRRTGPPSSRVSEFDQPSRADEVDNWASVKKPLPSFDSGGSAEPVLAEKGLDWKKLDSEFDAKKTSRPTSANSSTSRPSSAQSNRSDGSMLQGATEILVKAKPKVNPFGDAKPREVLLEERGQDWRKIDLELEHRRVDRTETAEEKMLKEEIDNLKKELEKESTINSNKESIDEAGEDQTSIRAVLLQKETELEALIRDLDDKVRFGQKATERPGSAGGKTTGFPDRPPSQSGSFEDSRSVEFADRPRSRGTGDMWMRTGDDKRPFQGSRDRGGFLSSRDLN
ncbi:Plant specific eukaryotic initiation factor 4B, partial [Sesbania bispinosa]